MSATIIIKHGREKPIRQGHPWVFSGSIQNIVGKPAAGDLVDVKTERGDFLATGYWNERSQIQVRLLSWRDEGIDEGWWRDRLRRAIGARMAEQRFKRGQVDAFRLVHAESDYLPGLILDVYGRWIVLQALTLGIDERKQMIADMLPDIWRDFVDRDRYLAGVYERSDVDVRRKEGLRSAEGVLWGEEPPEMIVIREGDLRYQVDVRAGHKTGFYLDQRDNRALTQRLIADVIAPASGKGYRALNLFSYTGGFGVAARKGGGATPGHTVNVDSSREVLTLAEDNFALNFADGESDWASASNFYEADAFDYVRGAAADGERFDLIACDPPKFAASEGQVERAARGYKDLNLHAFKLVKPGGFLLTFSCSGAVSRDLFQKIIFGALIDSGRDGQIVAQLSAGVDHPIALTFPEGDYLKGLVVRVF